MTSASISALSTELEELSRAFGRTDIADAAASCRGARDAVLAVAVGPSSTELDALLASAQRAGANDLGPAAVRAVRAERLALIVSARAALDAASLGLVGALLQKRPRAGVAVVLTDAGETSAEALPNLERRAWRTLVKSPPSDPAGRSLSDYHVFLIGEAAEESTLRARFTDDRAAFARWLASAQPAADALDVIALMDLCVELRDGQPERRAVPPSSDRDDPAVARKTRIRRRVMRRIDEALGEIDRTVSADIRRASAETYAEIAEARFAQNPEETLESAFTAAVRRLHERFGKAVRDIGSDLEEALADDLLEPGAGLTRANVAEAVVRVDSTWIVEPRIHPKIGDAPETGTPQIRADSLVSGLAGGVAGATLAKFVMLPVAPFAAAGLLAGVAIDNAIRTRRHVNEDKRIQARAALDSAFGEVRSAFRAALDEARASMRERVDAAVDDIGIPSTEPPSEPSSSDTQRLNRLLATLAAYAPN